MLSALNDAGAEYLVVGAYAMAAHGCPRATGDIDFWVNPTEQNARRVWQALRVFGAPLSQIRIEDFLEPDVVFQIGLPPQRIDLLTSVSGVNFDEAWQNKVQTNLGELDAFVIGLDELLKNKIASGRPKDLLDADILRKR